MWPVLLLVQSEFTMQLHELTVLPEGITQYGP
jgi:hypothetical protein